MDELTPVPYGQDTSPFDRIAQTGPDGIRRWSGRDLMTLMGYARWENFAPALDRARRSADRVGVDVTSHFLRSQKVSGSRGPAQEDVLLTRYAAHLVAMNGDPGKVEVAAAQAYFSARDSPGRRRRARAPGEHGGSPESDSHWWGYFHRGLDSVGYYRNEPAGGSRGARRQ